MVAGRHGKARLPKLVRDSRHRRVSPIKFFLNDYLAVKKALYFVLQVLSDDPAKFGDNKLVKQLEIAAPPLKK